MASMAPVLQFSYASLGKARRVGRSRPLAVTSAALAAPGPRLRASSVRALEPRCRPSALCCGARTRRAVAPAAIMPSTSTNPALRHAQIDPYQMDTGRGGEIMTLEGAVDKTALLMLLAAGSAAWSWAQIYGGAMAVPAVLGMTKAAGIAGLVLAMATCFKPHWAPYTTPFYALAKGLALGGTSAFMEMMYPGLVIQTLSLTFGTLLSLLLAYRSGFMRFNEGFRSQVYTATGGFFIGMMGMWAMRMCGVAVPWLTSGPIGIGIGLFSVGLAASHLLLDFDNIQSKSYQQMPKWYEWYSGFSLLVTLVWMYSSIMRVLMMLRGVSSSNE